MEIPILWRYDPSRPLGIVAIDDDGMTVELLPVHSVVVLESVKHDGDSPEYITKAKVVAFSIV